MGLRGAVRYGLVALLVGTTATYAAGPLFLDRAEELRFLRTTELLRIRLQALMLEPVEEQARKALQSDLPLLAGSLEAKDPSLLLQLEELLRRLGPLVEAKDTVGLEATFRRAGELLNRTERALVPGDDPALRAALMAQLLLLDDGVAEGYEDATRGEEGAYKVAWSGLQRVKELWKGLKPSLQAHPDQAARVEEGLGVLGRLLNSPEPPGRFQDPEDAEQAALDVAFALAEALEVELLPRDLPEVLVLVERETDHACRAYPGQPRLALERVAAARLYYRAYLENTVKTLAPETGEKLDLLWEGLSGMLQPAALPSAREPAGVAAECESLKEALAQAGLMMR